MQRGARLRGCGLGWDERAVGALMEVDEGLTPRRRAPTDRGFTLVELLTVVAIVGVLATIAVFGVGSYIRQSKTGEAIAMVNDIRAAEEAFRSETFRYLNVTGAGTTPAYKPLHPADPPGKKYVSWQGWGTTQEANFRTLGIAPTTGVRFAYAVAAVSAGSALPEPIPSDVTFGFASYTAQPAYCVLAVGDLNGDGKFSYVVGHSMGQEVNVVRSGE